MASLTQWTWFWASSGRWWRTGKLWGCKELDTTEWLNNDNIFFGLPSWLKWLRIHLQCRTCGHHPWMRKIPWRRKWQPTPVFLPGKSCGQRSLAGYSPWGHKVRHDWATEPLHLRSGWGPGKSHRESCNWKPGIWLLDLSPLQVAFVLCPSPWQTHCNEGNPETHIQEDCCSGVPQCLHRLVRQAARPPERLSERPLQRAGVRASWSPRVVGWRDTLKARVSPGSQAMPHGVSVTESAHGSLRACPR